MRDRYGKLLRHANNGNTVFTHMNGHGGCDEWKMLT